MPSDDFSKTTPKVHDSSHVSSSFFPLYLDTITLTLSTAIQEMPLRDRKEPNGLGFQNHLLMLCILCMTLFIIIIYLKLKLFLFSFLPHFPSHF